MDRNIEVEEKDQSPGLDKKKELTWNDSFRSHVEARVSCFGVAPHYLGVDTLFAAVRNRTKRISDRSSELILDEGVVHWVRVWVRIGKRVRVRR